VPDFLVFLACTTCFPFSALW